MNEEVDSNKIEDLKQYEFTLKFKANQKDLDEFLYAINLSAESWEKHKRLKDYSCDLKEIAN